MPANTSPIFSAKGSIQWNPAILTAANTAKDGTGTVATVFTGNAAGNNAGNFVQKLIARPLASETRFVRHDPHRLVQAIFDIFRRTQPASVAASAVPLHAVSVLRSNNYHSSITLH